MHRKKDIEAVHAMFEKYKGKPNSNRDLAQEIYFHLSDISTGWGWLWSYFARSEYRKKLIPVIKKYCPEIFETVAAASAHTSLNHSIAPLASTAGNTRDAKIEALEKENKELRKQLAAVTLEFSQLKSYVTQSIAIRKMKDLKSTFGSSESASAQYSFSAPTMFSSSS